MMKITIKVETTFITKYKYLLTGTVLLLLNNLGCEAGPSDPEIGIHKSTIINGIKLDTPYPAVLFLGNKSEQSVDDPTKQGCTGTLIGKRTILTAAHCFPMIPNSVLPQKTGIDKIYLPYKISQFNPSTNSLEPITDSNVFRVKLHNDFKGAGPNNTAIDTEHDIAIILLDEDVKNISPIAIANVPPTENESIEMIGYGCLQVGQDGKGKNWPGRQYQGRHNVGDKKNIFNSWFKTQPEYIFQGTILGSQPKPSPQKPVGCFGDSGGPAFATRDGQKVHIGVTSNVHLSNPFTTSYVRSDAYKDWISTWAEENIESIPNSSTAANQGTIGEEGSGNQKGEKESAGLEEQSEGGYAGCSIANQTSNTGAVLFLLLSLAFLIYLKRSMRSSSATDYSHPRSR